MTSSQFVDISKFPEDEKPHIIELAKKHNALSEDVDKISGITPEEKAIMHRLFAIGLKAGSYLHSKRFNILLGSAQLWLAAYFLKAIGVDLTRFGPAINKLLDLFISSQ